MGILGRCWGFSSGLELAGKSCGVHMAAHGTSAAPSFHTHHLSPVLGVGCPYANAVVPAICAQSTYGLRAGDFPA